MRQVFDEPELDEREHETEIVLGSTGVVLAVAGFLVICGLCFSLGLVVGHHDSSPAPVASARPASAPADAPLLTSSRAKPSAAAQPATASAQAVESSASSSAPAGDPDGGIVTPGQSAPSPTPAPSAPSTASAQPAVRPAFPPQPVQPSTTPIAGAPAAAVTPSAGALMVQIAAVSHSEDANVLVNALRRRGYSVSVRRDPLDGLLHVQVGPFTNRNDANTMKMKLLNDGYNAIVEP